MPNPLTTVGQMLSDLAFLAGLVQPTPERNRRRARRKLKRAARATRRGNLARSASLHREAVSLRVDADLLAKGE